MIRARDELGRFATPRATNRRLSRPAFAARASALVAAHASEPGFALWVRGARESWRGEDGPNPFERVQIPMAIGGGE